MHAFLDQLANGIALGGIYALIALGYTMVYGIVELINFAHGDVYTLGSFFALAILSALGVSGELHGVALVVDITIAVVGAALLCGIVGVLIERLAYRRLRGAPRLAPLITAIGVSFVLENVMMIWKGPAPVSFPEVMPNPAFVLGPLTVSLKQLLVVGLALALMAALHTFVKTTALGRAMRATAQDRDAAQLMGIDINRTIAATFFIGALLAGAGGIIWGLYYNTVYYQLGFRSGLIAFTAAVFGGIGNIPGAAIGGLLIGMTAAFSDGYIGSKWTQVVIFGILIGVLVFRPTGLLGMRVPEK